MNNILLLEPASSGKRRTFSDIFIKPEKAVRPGLKDIEKRLREIRDYSLSRQDALFKELMTGLDETPGVDVSFSDDAHLAVKKIKEISGNSPVVINKSAVVKRELVPLLNMGGYTVIESYYDQFKPFDNRFKEYWQLPDMLFDSLWNSFEKPVDLNLVRKRNIQGNGYKDFTGLMGVNAISANDGSIVMLQHMSNIRMIFEQARKIILIVGLDKIVRDRDEALFLAKCMAAFGVETLPLNFNGSERPEDGIKTLPFNPVSQTVDHIHMILLDNGRSRILQGEYKDLLACIGCRACMKVCPASRHFAEDANLSPREYIYLFISGQNPSVEKCLQCKSCEANCPLNIDLPGMILKGKQRMSKKHRPLSDQLLSNVDIFEELGSNIPWLVSMASKNRILRGLGEKLTGISRKRRFPDMKRGTFIKRFHSMEERIDGDRKDV